MKKVLLFAPFTKGDIFSYRFVTPPLGVWRVASYLNKNGHKCVVYDSACPDNTMSFEEIVKSEKWDLIGFSTLAATEEYDIAKMFKVKQLSPGSVLVAGGNGAALNYQFILDKTPIDIVVLAEGEYPMLDLCNDKRWQDIEGIVFRKRARILTNEDYWEISKDLEVGSMRADCYWKKTAGLYEKPDFGEINTFRLFTANYCPMGCSFCTLTLWKKYATGCRVPVVGLTPEQNLYLVKKVVTEYPNVKQIFFVTDDFFLIKGHGEKFCEIVIKEKKKGKLPSDLAFICLTNIVRISKRNVKLMKQAGFRVLSIGVESTSQFVLDSLNKKQTEKQIWEGTKLILDAGLRPYYTVLLFTPYCRIEDLEKDLEGFRKLSTMGAGISVEPYLIPLSGTPLREEGVPESMRWVLIEGTDVKIRKGFAWLPIDPEVREVFDEFEKWFPKYKRYRFSNDGVRHKEKNYQSLVTLDALEIILKAVFGIGIDSNIVKRREVNSLYRMVNEMESLNLDTVGEFTQVVGGR